MYNLTLLIAILIGVAGQIFFKIGALEVGALKPALVNFIFNQNIIVGVFLYGLSTVFYIYSLQKIPLSIAYPTIAFGYIFVVILSSLIFKEKISYYQISGMLFIIIGIALLWKK